MQRVDVMHIPRLFNIPLAQLLVEDDDEVVLVVVVRVVVVVEVVVVRVIVVGCGRLELDVLVPSWMMEVVDGGAELDVVVVPSCMIVLVDSEPETVVPAIPLGQVTTPPASVEQSTEVPLSRVESEVLLGNVVDKT